MPKLSGSFGRSRRSIRSAASRRPSPPARVGSIGRTVSSSDCRARRSAGSAERHDAYSSCDWPKIEPFFARHADDAEVDARQRDHLVDRIDRPKEPVGRVPAENRTGGRRRIRSGVIARPRSMFVVGQAIVFLRDAADCDAVERLAAVLACAAAAPRPSPS
jgi:hypothetical protein